MQFTYVKGGVLPAAQPLAVASQTTTQLSFRLALSDPWITVAPEKGNTPGIQSVSVNPTGLTVGQYTGTIKITSPPFPPAFVEILLTISNPAGKLILDPAGPTDLEGRVDDLNLPTRIVRVFTDGNPADFSIKTSPVWLLSSPSSGTAAAFSPAVINLSIDPTSLIVGQKTPATLTVTGTGTPPSTASLVVNVMMNPGVVRLSSIWPETLNVSLQDAVLTLHGVEFYPTFTSVTINKAAAKLTVLSPTVATLIIPAALIAKTGNLEITLRNLSKDASATQLIPIVASVPVISTVLNAASFELPADGSSPFVSSGELVSIFGVNLGPERVTVAAPNKKGEYASILGSTKVQVKVNEVWLDAIPLFSYKTQINALLPFKLTSPSIELRVENGGVQSLPIPLAVRDATPGIFTMDSSGSGQAAVMNYDSQGQYAGTNSILRPVKAGSFIAMYATGCGAFTVDPAMGSIVALSKDLAVPVSKVLVGFDDLPLVPADWAGVVPGMVAGLCQINVKVPPILNPRKDVSLHLNFNGNRSGPGTSISVAAEKQ